MFFDHRGLLEGREARAVHDTGASSFLYPFLGEAEHDLEAVVADVRESVAMKAHEVAGLREQTLGEADETLPLAARELRDRLERGGQVLALGNGGSATDAMDAVADLRSPPRDWPARAALDLTADPAILTAIANDVGVEPIFQRQVIAYGREEDALLAFSTSGNSTNVIAALAEARGRGLLTVALGGLRRRSRGRRAARRPCAGHPLGAHPEDPGSPGERVARAPRADRARPEVNPAGRLGARVEGLVQGVGFRPYVHRLAVELGLSGFVLNDERGVLIEVEGPSAALDEFVRRLPAEAPSLAVVERVLTTVLEATGEAGFEIRESRRGGEPEARVSADAATCADCLAELFDPADRRHRYPFVNCTALRSPLHDRARRALRPPAHDDGGLHHVRALPRRVRGPGRQALPRRAQRLPGVRADAAPRRRAGRCRARGRRGGAPLGLDRRRQGAGRIPPGLPGRPASPPWRRCARASAARTGRSP